jgi:TolB-like protein
VARTLWLLLTLGATSVAHAAPPSPVAVMPFQNLQRAADLEWLESGVSETMISDLKRSGAVEIVERGQIDRAMAEIALQGAIDLYNPSEAARVGKIVGAKTIVVGAFQRAGKRLRITARFVEVETGVVKGTAKATGPLKNVFALQDAIVDELIHGKRKPPRKKRLKKRPTRKKTKRALAAYRVYSMSLTAPDAKRLGMLREAVKLDPDLQYASDDLAALERRLRGYDAAAGAAQGKTREATLARVLDKKAPAAERVALAKAHLSALEENRRYRALTEDAPRITRLGLPANAEFDPGERAAWGLVLGNARLRKLDLALQAGERYLKTFPSGPHYREVEALVREIMDERRGLKEQRASFAEDFADAVEGARELKAAKTKRTATAWEDVDWTECLAAKWARLPDEMLEHCRDYLGRWAGRSDDEDIAERVPDASAWVIWARGQRGEFAEALRLAGELRASHPRALADAQVGDGHKVHSVEEHWMRRWPTDAR